MNAGQWNRCLKAAVALSDLGWHKHFRGWLFERLKMDEELIGLIIGIGVSAYVVAVLALWNK